jgi:hypothetical protein
MTLIKTSHFVAEYSCGTYSSGDYQGSCATATSDALANTGFDLLIPIFIGVSLVFASAVLLVRRMLRKRRQQPTQAN